MKICVCLLQSVCFSVNERGNQYIFALISSDVFFSGRLHESGVRREILVQPGKLLGISVYKIIKKVG